MRIIAFVSIFFYCLSEKSQNDVALKKYMIESIKPIKEFSEEDLYYSSHGSIKYKGIKYIIYDFGFKPVLHEPYLYILFYECDSCDNVVLGKADFLKDLLTLNKFFIHSRNFNKKRYSILFNILKNDYLPGKQGKIINREDIKKEGK